MDDAGIPSLLGVSYLDPSMDHNPLTLASRRFSLSTDDPWFIQGKAAQGVGSVHTGNGMIWPMAIICRAMTSTDNAEITACLNTLKRTTAGTSFMHESFNADDPSNFTRKWFAWVNNLYGEMIEKILRERQALLENPLNGSATSETSAKIP